MHLHDIESVMNCSVFILCITDSQCFPIHGPEKISVACWRRNIKPILHCTVEKNSLQMY
jgi:hypothetical protein